jgi:beta-glucosidase
MISRSDFGDDFHWGVSTAAYQIEGAHNIHGKGVSIWDKFVQKKGRILNHHHGNTACNFYHSYPADLKIIQDLAIPNHRFSISWSRLIPDGTGRISRKGVDFYNNLIDLSLAMGIEPWVTLYHWDLPQSLEEEGGWTNRDIISWFGNYVECCIKYFGDRVKNWIVLNEPLVFTGAGYFLGIHAPGRKGLKNFLGAAHHAAICQAEGGRLLRNHNKDYHIGTTFSCSHVEPYRPIEKDITATKKADALLNRMFIEPLLGMGYPVNDLPLLKRMDYFMKPGDEAKLAFDMDFIGIQNYTREIVKHSFFVPFLQAKVVKAGKRNVETTLMNWEVYPRSIYHMLKKMSEYKNIKEIIVTENGAAFKDEIHNGMVADPRRIKYLEENIMNVLYAKNEGVNVKGYFVWTLLDNFEWAEGFHPTFGLVHVDFNTMERRIKDSGYWYSRFLRR